MDMFLKLARSRAGPLRNKVARKDQSHNVDGSYNNNQAFVVWPQQPHPCLLNNLQSCSLEEDKDEN